MNIQDQLSHRSAVLGSNFKGYCVPDNSYTNRGIGVVHTNGNVDLFFDGEHTFYDCSEFSLDEQLEVSVVYGLSLEEALKYDFRAYENGFEY